MGLSISDIPSPINGCGQLITSVSNDGRTIHVLAGHEESDNFADMTFLTGAACEFMPSPLVGEDDQYRCNLHHIFGLSLTFHIRLDYARQMEPPDLGEKETTISTFLNKDTLREIEVIADCTSRLSGQVPEYDCDCAQCQSSFITKSGIRVGDNLPVQRNVIIDDIHATVFDIHRSPRSLRVQYSPSFTHSLIDIDLANTLGHRLHRNEHHHDGKPINVIMTLAKPGYFALSHVIQCLPCTFQVSGKGIIVLSDDDVRRLHSQSEYWDRCGQVSRRVGKEAERILEGSHLREAGLSRVIFHATDGTKYPTWVICGTNLPCSEISQALLRLMEPKGQASELISLQVEDEFGRIEDIGFRPVDDLHYVYFDSGLRTGDVFRVSITVRDWQHRSLSKEEGILPRDYGVYDNVILAFHNGTGAKLCLRLSEQEENFVSERIVRKLSITETTDLFGILDFNKMLRIPEGTKEPDLTYGREAAQDIFKRPFRQQPPVGDS
ncbi:hypothetical protein AYL99_12033 [Fonsecaea erecta]|uniref:Uncharacterized protein n=1 Tax=Fonsecaea erecta TaxID=1367422 RepID=A0A178Z242_9EURO|nr:hypothetical protein AYL99_12033 [Fonsecaea erecta]OAP53767.1 hypothetical protein AYL99_12033 [Fonsecaea erecta]